MTFRDAFFDELNKTAMNPMAAKLNMKAPASTGTAPAAPPASVPQIKPATDRAKHVAQFKERVRSIAGKRPWYTKPWALAGGGALAGVIGSKLLSRRDDE